MNLAHHLARAAALRPASPALGSGTDIVADFATLRDRVARLAGALRGRLGLAAGDRVAILMPNAPVYVELIYACWWAGLAALPINAKLHAREIAYILDHAEARLAFVAAETGEVAAAALRETGGGVTLIDVGAAEFRALHAGDPVAMASTEADDLAWLFYTRGTTGRPKGAMLTPSQPAGDDDEPTSPTSTRRSPATRCCTRRR